MAPSRNAVDAGFYSGLLVLLGAPVTQNNVRVLKAWGDAETQNGGSGYSAPTFNPLATSLTDPATGKPYAGATAFNNLPGGGHVWNYPTAKVGVTATALTLKNTPGAGYDNIIQSLKANRPAAETAQLINDSAWASGRIGSGRPGYAVAMLASIPVVPDKGSWWAGFFSGLVGAAKDPIGGIKKIPGDVGIVVGDAGKAVVGSVLGPTLTFVGRSLLAVFGGALLILGFVMLMRGGKLPAAPGELAAAAVAP